MDSKLQYTNAQANFATMGVTVTPQANTAIPQKRPNQQEVFAPMRPAVGDQYVADKFANLRAWSSARAADDATLTAAGLFWSL